jgi:predicted SAM-dependent methyltransferase
MEDFELPFSKGERIVLTLRLSAVSTSCRIPHKVSNTTISRELKILFYMLLSIPLAISGWFYRVFLSPRRGTVKVQLGPGKRNYLPGWVNVDANFITAKTDCITDFRRKLPFRDNTVDCLYSINVIEHVPDIDFHTREIFRCLKPGGIIRVGGPNLDSHIKKFLEGDLEWFSVFPDRRESVGGRFSNYLMMRGEHLHLLSKSFLEEVFGNAGFTEMKVCCPVYQTFHGDLFAPAIATEYESTPETPKHFLIEAIKPVTG